MSISDHRDQGKFISPNEALAQAKELMLEGRHPVTRDEWAIIMNCWAVNLRGGVALLKLMRSIFEIPLDDTFIEQMYAFHKAHGDIPE